MTLDHPDYQAMLAAVLADPADDVPRLILADWLEENAREVECRECAARGWRMEADYTRVARNMLPGGFGPEGVPLYKLSCLVCSGSGRVPNGFAERAEFIRVQCELATKSDCRGLDLTAHDPAKCRVEALRERERALLRGTGPDGKFNVCNWTGWPVSGRGWLDNGRIEFMPFGADGLKLEIEFRRGFVDSVTLPLRLWVGEPCERCHGEPLPIEITMRFSMEGLPPTCPACHGLGTVGGLGPELVRRCPLTKVTLVDREPVGHLDGGVLQWWWVDDLGFGTQATQYLPSDLFRLLQRDPSDIRGFVTIACYPTRQSALDALSATCLARAAERERCAKVADAFAVHQYADPKLVAAAIRKGPTR